MLLMDLFEKEFMFNQESYIYLICPFIPFIPYNQSFNQPVFRVQWILWPSLCIQNVFLNYVK